MTNRSRLILTAAVLLAIGISTTAIFLLTNAARNGTLSVQTIAFSVVILLAGVASVPVVYFTKIKRSKTEKLLDGEFLEAYELIRDVVFSSRLPKHTADDILDDVLDLMVTARHNNRPLKEIIADPRGFALKITEQYGGKKKYGIVSFLDSLLYMAGFTLGASALMWLKEPEQGIFNTPLDVSLLFLFGVISFWLVPYLKLNAAEKPKIVILPVIVGICFIAVSEILRRFFYESEAVRWFLDGQVNIISNGLALSAFLIAIPALILAKILLKKNRLHRLAGKGD